MTPSAVKNGPVQAVGIGAGRGLTGGQHEDTDDGGKVVDPGPHD